MLLGKLLPSHSRAQAEMHQYVLFRRPTRTWWGSTLTLLFVACSEFSFWITELSAKADDAKADIELAGIIFVDDTNHHIEEKLEEMKHGGAVRCTGAASQLACCYRRVLSVLMNNTCHIQRAF